MKWLKCGLRKGFIFHTIIPAPNSHHAWILIIKKNKIVIKTMKVEKMVVLVKIFDHYHLKFNFGHLFSWTVKL